MYKKYHVKKTAELQQRFETLMEKFKDNESADFTDEEVQFMGDYDICTFDRKFPDWCTYYMEYMDIETDYWGEVE